MVRERTRSTKGEIKNPDNFCMLLTQHKFYTRLTLTGTLVTEKMIKEAGKV